MKTEHQDIWNAIEELRREIREMKGEMIFCPTCKGEGVTHHTNKDEDCTSATDVVITCWRCGGTGKVKR